MLCNEFEIENKLDDITSDLKTKNANLIRESSGLVISEIQFAKLNIIKYNPLSGSSYQKLPSYLASKKAIINIQNTDNRCFGYAVLASLHPINRYAYEPKKYKRFFEQFNLHNLDYPVQPFDVPHIETILRRRINIFTFHDEEGKILHPLYHSKAEFAEEIDLLYFKQHYALIKDFDRLFFTMNKHGHRLHFCKQCLGHFSNEQVLAKHKHLCKGPNFQTQLISFPDPGTTLKFTNIAKKQRLPFIVYVDFECLTKELSYNENSKTKQYQQHVPSSVGYILVKSADVIIDNEYHSYTGEDCVEWLLRKLQSIEIECLDYIFNDKRMIFDEEDEVKYVHYLISCLCYPYQITYLHIVTI